MRSCLPILAALLLSGCITIPQQGSAPAQPQVIKPPSAAAMSGWLNAAQPLDSEIRLTTPDGIDLRQACYVPAMDTGTDEHCILVRTRNYSDRIPGRPDQQILTRFQPSSKEQSELVLAEGFPVKILVDTDHHKWVVAALTPTPEQELHEADFSIFVPDSSGKLQVRLMPERQYPRMLQYHRIGLSDISAIQLDGGLLNVSWKSDRFMHSYSLTNRQSADPLGGFSIMNDTGGDANYSVRFNPASPDNARVTYKAGIYRSSVDIEWHTFEYPFHVTYSTSAWEPPLMWVDGRRLATLLFLPDATGRSRRANHLGLFRLVTLDAESGYVTLIEDHLDAHLPVVTADGVLFYVRQAPGEEEPAWEVWASSADGLSKRRILSEPNALFLSLEDALPDRLLLQRQYMEVVDNTPHLYSELSEFSLVPLHAGGIELSGVGSLDLLPGSSRDAAAAVSQEDASGTPPAVSVD